MRRTSDYLNEVANNDKLFYELSEEERIELRLCLLSIYNDINQICVKYGLTLMLGGEVCWVQYDTRDSSLGMMIWI